MVNHFGSNLDQLGQEGAKGPMVDPSGKDETPQEVAQVVGQNKESQPHLIPDKALAGQPRPVQGVLAFLDPLLGGAAPVVKVNHPWSLCAPMGHNETNSRKEFAAMPNDRNNVTPFPQRVSRTGPGTQCTVPGSTNLERDCAQTVPTTT